LKAVTGWSRRNTLSDPATSRKQALELILSLLQARHSNLPAVPRDSLRGAFKEALDLAANHQVASALCSGLCRIASKGSAWNDLVPIVQMVEAQNLTRNKILHNAALKIAALLNSAEIRCVFLKGAAMVLDSRNNAPWRLVTDLDILVAPNTLNGAVSSLLQHGYRQKADYAGFEEGIHHHYPALYDEESNTFVELHVRLMQNQKENPLETSDIFEQAIPLERDGQILLTPCPEHRMIHLIAHAQISNWGYVLRQILLKDAVDTVELDACHAIDWNVVRKAFVDIRAEDELLGFVWAVHQLLHFRLPFLESETGDGKAWADEALVALYVPQKAWRTSVRVIGHYLSLFARNPMRLKMVWKTFKNFARLKHLLSINRGRLE
jgi:hypothetical protein